MSNSHLSSILKSHSRDFYNSFEEAKELYKVAGGSKLIHPFEYGYYREAVVRQFISPLIPRVFDIEEGFIINQNDEISGQTDVIVYDNTSTPLLRGVGLNRFFPTETVALAGEIKSKLKLETGETNLKNTLERLIRIKELRDYKPKGLTVLRRNKTEDNAGYYYKQVYDKYNEITKFLKENESEIYKKHKDELLKRGEILFEIDEKDLNPKNKDQFKSSIEELKYFKENYEINEYNHIKNHFDITSTFIICESFDLKSDEKLEELPQLIAEWFKDIPRYLWHNMILSLEDGLLLYRDETKEELAVNCYPIFWGNDQKGVFIPANEEKDHLRLFFKFLFELSTNATILYPEIGDYMEDIKPTIAHTE